MGVMSIRDFNANVSRAFARVEAGERLKITRNGKVIAEISPDGESADAEVRRKQSMQRLRELIAKGIPLGGPFDYDERTSR